MNALNQDIINLTRLGTNDGGSQNACSFLQQLSEIGDRKRYCVVAFKDTAAGNLTQKLGFDNILIGRNVSERIHFDLSCRKFFKRGQLCLTFFGAPWYKSRGYLVNVSGVADSNLYYPEIPFWKHCTIPQQAYKYVKDRGRMFGYSGADYWIFETEVLAQRAVDLAGYPKDRVATVKMSASAFVSPEKVSQEVCESFKKRIGEGFSLLFMAGANPNKRITCVAAALAEIRANGTIKAPVRAVTTLDPDSNYCRTVEGEFRRLGVEDAWVNLGPVAFDEIPSLIDACDVICLFSVLESFSSNITEAWAMKKPLLASDYDWARSACGNAAMFVSPENASQVADAVVRLMQHDERKKLLDLYGAQYKTHPTASERCRQYLECMEAAKELGSLSREECKAVRKFASRRRGR